MKYLIKHTTCYNYMDTVSLCRNIIHVSPREYENQRNFFENITVTPTPEIIEFQKATSVLILIVLLERVILTCYLLRSQVLALAVHVFFFALCLLLTVFLKHSTEMDEKFDFVSFDTRMHSTF